MVVYALVQGTITSGCGSQQAGPQAGISKVAIGFGGKEMVF
jgi:hypothetical protein